MSLTAAIEHSLSNTNKEVLKVTFEGADYWVKRTRPPKYALGHAIYSAIMNRLPFPALRMPHMPSGIDALKHEAACMQALRNKGVRVPEVIYLTHDYMVMSDVGPTMQSFFYENPAAEMRLRIATEGGAALASLHAKGCWHGRAALRDVTLTDNGVGFIDFEADVEHVLSLPLRQARDIWFYCHGLARFSMPDPILVNAALEAYSKEASKEVLRALYVALTLLMPFYYLLYPVKRWMSRDVTQAMFATYHMRAFIKRIR